MIDLDALEAAVRQNRPMEIAGLFEHATEAERRQSRMLLRALEAEERSWWEDWKPGRLLRDNPVQRGALDAFRLATTPSPEGAARILRESRFNGEVPAEQAPIILARQVRWKPALLDLLTTAVRDSSQGRSETPWHVVDALLEQSGLVHLETPGYALEYLRRHSSEGDPDAMLALDPALPALLLRAVESSRLDDASREDFAKRPGERGEDRWAKIAAAWSRSGHLDRAELHRALLHALVRGGVQPHLRAVLRFLDELSPTSAEIQGLQREYLALIESDFSAVATHAMAALRAADKAAPLGSPTVVEACERALTRAEAATGTAALAWLKVLLKRDPSSAADVARAVERGLVHPRRTVQAKAAELAFAVPAVPGGSDGSTIDASSSLPDLPPLPPCPPLEAPESLDALMHVLRRSYHFADEERSILGFARFSGEMSQEQRDELTELGRAFRVAEGLSAGFRRRPGLLHGLRDFVKGAPPAADLVASRAREVGMASGGRAAVTLLAVPRDLSGLVDPEAVLEGLQRLRRDRQAALPLDLEAAWLRLPTSAYDGDFATQVDRIGGRDAAWLAAELRRGPVPTPGLGVHETPTRHGDPDVGAIGAWPEATGRGGALMMRLADLVAGLITNSPNLEEAPEVALTPAHRDVIAAHSLRYVYALYGYGGIVEHLALLPHQEGRLGPPSHTMIALSANAEKAPLRAAALDSTLGLLATGALDGKEDGQAWAFLQHRNDVKLGRWTAHLTEVAQSSWAGSRYAWEVLRQVLDVGLPGELPNRSGVADLVALAADVAATVGGKGRIDGLTEVAERPGKSRIVTEAKRLQSVLAG